MPRIGFKFSIESKEKMSKAKQGKYNGKNNPMYGRKGKDNPNYGRKQSPETRKKVSDSKKGIPRSEETKRKLSEARKKIIGWKHSLETCQKISEKNRGKNHYNWKGGKSFELYPLGWNKTFKEQIRRRDNYKCQICGKPEVEASRRLDVHHIDYDKNNLVPTNLITLCHSCHSKTNHNHEYWRISLVRQKVIY